MESARAGVGFVANEDIGGEGLEGGRGGWGRI